jgi:hypothetical protein
MKQSGPAQYGSATKKLHLPDKAEKRMLEINLNLSMTISFFETIPKDLSQYLISFDP